MVVTESQLRSQLRRPRANARVEVPAGAQLSPSAQDFVKQWQLQVVSVGEGEPAPSGAPVEEAAWNRASTFPVSPGDDVRCTCCGGVVEHKGDLLTQLNAHHYVVKNHPRIRLRGQVDSLHAQVLMAEWQARAAGMAWLGDHLSVLAAYCRELLSAEYNERPCAELALSGWDAERLHQATHDPVGVLGVPHATIDGHSHPLQHWLNLCRTTARQLEITAVDVFPSPHHPYGAAIVHALNRLSSAFYLLQLLVLKEETE